MSSHFTFFIIILSGMSVSNSYRILSIFPYPGRSHFHVLSAVAKTLAQKGHKVDVISHFKLEEPFPNYTELDFSETVPHARLEFNATFSSAAEQAWQTRQITQVCNLLDHPTVNELTRNPSKIPAYDAVIVHTAIASECVLAVGHVLNVPVIAVVTSMPYAMFQQFIGNPLNLAITPGHTHYYKQNLTFWERVENVVHTHSQLRKYKSYGDMQEKFIKTYLGDDSPHYLEMHKNIALMFTNSHYSFYGIKPRTPALVEIGGIHITNETSKLSPDLANVLDESVHGFIYFSFGTLTVLESLPTDFSNNIFTTFCKISPIRVIMRVPNPDFIPQKLCNNVFTYIWLPQQKVLEHPKIKAFVTHGGGLSTQETIHHAVPVICVPITADQKINCDILSLKNMGVEIDITTAKQKDYEDAFQQILTNPKYKDEMRKLSQIYWDRPQSPQEAVVYWVEYVIRHGKNVLRSPAVDLEWWQFDLIDVYCFLIACFIILISLVIIIIVNSFRLIMRLSCPINKIKSNKKSN